VGIVTEHENADFRDDLRSQLVATGTVAAEQWLATRANRRMSDVNRRRLAGYIVNALWADIENAAIGIAEFIADTRPDEHPLVRAAREQGIKPVTDVEQLAAAAEHRLSDEEFKTWSAAMTECRADPTEQLRTELDAANAECARATKRADLIDATLDAMRQQAIDAVKERNAANERAEKAEAELCENAEHIVLVQQYGAELMNQRDEAKNDYANLSAEADRIADRAGRYRTERDEARARLAEIGKATVWGQPRTEWTWSARKPDGTAIPPMFPDPPPRTEDEVRREFDGVVDNMGYRKVLLCREVTAWRDAGTADATGTALSATETGDDGSPVSMDAANSSTTAAGLTEAEDDRDTSAWCWTPNPHGPLRCGRLKNHPMPHRRGERTWTDETGTE
jgi:hypothetical protein